NIGFEVVGVEISERAINILKQKLSPHVKNKASILAGDFMKMNFYKKFDIVFALEVLEHIQDDETAIRKLSNFLSPDGKLIISVPAHMKYWTQWDIIAGHYRRYERGELIHKLLNCKLQVKKLLCYGFPFGTIISLIIAPFIPKLKGSINNRTKLSGIYRPLEERLPLIFNIIIKLMLPIQLKLQNLFLDKDFGHGYLIVASMRGSAQDSIIDSHH
ncbi:MAG: class I SAM-dependent methyltransferase, partial [Candidatus Bathyarchaeia archaeon]